MYQNCDRNRTFIWPLNYQYVISISCPIPCSSQTIDIIASHIIQHLMFLSLQFLAQNKIYSYLFQLLGIFLCILMHSFVIIVHPFLSLQYFDLTFHNDFRSRYSYIHDIAKACLLAQEMTNVFLLNLS